MSTLYTARVSDASGNRLATFANFVEAGSGASLDYVLSVGKVGVLTMTLPATVDTNLLPLDGRIGIWRSVNGAAPVLDGDAVFLIRKWDLGTDYTTVTALHANDLLTRRIIDYYAGSAESHKAAAAAADQIRAFINENMLGGITVNRYGNQARADISAHVSLQAALGLGASVAKAAAWRNLHEVIQEVADSSTQGGTYVTAEIVAPTESTLESRTYATQRGVDHRASSGQPVVFSESRGNLKDPVLTIDRTYEVTWALAGGQGEGILRQTASSLDATRIQASPLNRREVFTENTNATSSAQLQAAADAAVWAGRPIQVLTADLVETPGCTRGIHFNLGDMVTIEHRGYTLDVRLDLIHEVVTPTERRSEIRVQAVLPA